MANELQLNYPEIISKIEGHYRDTIALIADVGNKIDKKLHFEPENKKLIIGRDTLKRIHSNINVLINIKISEPTVVAYRLILRAMFADFVEAIYLVASENKKLEKELWKRNLEAVRTFELWIKGKAEFYKKVDKLNTSTIDVNKMYPYFTEYVNPEFQTEFYSKKQHKKLDTASMAKHLETV